MSLNDMLGLLACLLEEFNSLEGDEFDSFESFLCLKGFSSEAESILLFLFSHIDGEGNIIL